MIRAKTSHFVSKDYYEVESFHRSHRVYPSNSKDTLINLPKPSEEGISITRCLLFIKYTTFLQKHS